MTAIRPATEADLPAIVRMAARFLSVEGPYGTRFHATEDAIAGLARQMLGSPDSLGLVAVVDEAVIGMFGAFCFTHPIMQTRMAAELCWWMDPEARGSNAARRLLHEAERWARRQGATAIEMIAPSERVGRIYERDGYQRTDVHYLKDLTA